MSRFNLFFVLLCLLSFLALNVHGQDWSEPLKFKSNDVAISDNKLNYNNQVDSIRINFTLGLLPLKTSYEYRPETKEIWTKVNFTYTKSAKLSGVLNEITAPILVNINKNLTNNYRDNVINLPSGKWKYIKNYYCTSTTQLKNNLPALNGEITSQQLIDAGTLLINVKFDFSQLNTTVGDEIACYDPIGADAQSTDWVFFNNNAGGNLDAKYFNGTNFTAASISNTNQQRNLKCLAWERYGIACVDYGSDQQDLYVFNITNNVISTTAKVRFGGTATNGHADVEIFNNSYPIFVSTAGNSGNSIRNVLNITKAFPNGSLKNSELVTLGTGRTIPLEGIDLYLLNGTSQFVVTGHESGGNYSHFIAGYNGNSWTINLTYGGGPQQDGNYPKFLCPEVGNKCILFYANHTAFAQGNTSLRFFYKNNFTISGEYPVYFGNSQEDGHHLRGWTQACPVVGTDQIVYYSVYSTGNDIANMFIFNMSPTCNSANACTPEGGRPTLSQSATYTISGFAPPHINDCFVDRKTNRTVMIWQRNNGKSKVWFNWWDANTKSWKYNDLSASPGYWARNDSTANIISVKASTNIYQNETVLTFVETGGTVFSGVYWNGNNFTGTPVNITGGSNKIENEASLDYEYVITDRFVGGNSTSSPDTTPPVISSLTNSTTTNQSVKITWSTNENANESNTLGVCPSFTGTFSNKNSTSGTSHLQAIGSLVNFTNYCYNTTACDSSGNCASSNFSFRTAANTATSSFASESEGDTSIGTGIQNSLLSAYTNYTTQIISARALSGNQYSGTFDWMAKKGTKVWAFNYVTAGESHVVGTFNITPNVYVMQIGNLTQAQITLQVAALINATK